MNWYQKPNQEEWKLEEEKPQEPIIKEKWTWGKWMRKRWKVKLALLLVILFFLFLAIRQIWIYKIPLWRWEK